MTKEGFAKIEARFDGRGNQIEWGYFGVNDEPVFSVDGYAKRTAKYDERNARSRSRICAKGEPIIGKEGYAKWTAVFDAAGNRVASATFGPDGKPLLRRDGHAKWTGVYDERGNLIEEIFLGLDDLPVERVRSFAARNRLRRGRSSSRDFEFKPNGQMADNEQGFARWTAKYNERGYRSESATFDSNGQPVLRRDGYAKWMGWYDERGNLITQMYFDVDGKPRPNSAALRP